MSLQVVKRRREGLAPCMTCPLCHKLFREATTIIECLHTFCRKCINKKLSDEELECCPVCNIDLGCVPLEKLSLTLAMCLSGDHLSTLQGMIISQLHSVWNSRRQHNFGMLLNHVGATPVNLKLDEFICDLLYISELKFVLFPALVLDHNLQDVREKIFPYKRMKVRAPEVVSPVTSPVKRKERSLSSLVVSTPRVSTQSGMTGRRSRSITRKASRACFLQSSIASDPSKHPSPDKGRENGSETLEGKVDWKPLKCLVEAANMSKSSEFSMQGVVSKSEAPNSHDNEGPNKSRSKENRQKSKLQDVKNFNNHTPPDSVRPKKLRKVRQKKTQDFGEFRVPPQVVLDAAGAKLDHKNHPIWFSLVADGQEGDALPLPQITASYFRIKEGGMMVSSIHKYLKLKLDLTSEDEVEIKCMGKAVIPTLTLNNVVDLWLQTTTTEKVSAKIGSSAKDLVMVLGYARRS
ncbi:hypothetical protein SASPL_137696 [Salvia splendens]|uniref:RING-type domain-containing protein n=1 Tax=Salvia splendens TaxID=180675 RepID=A0A8X8WTW6_SALSN|nr:hypothetical protein SASPL_137696 [Salvia splendens]